MLPRSIPCYKAFYQDGDGILHTKYGDATVSVGGRLMVRSASDNLFILLASENGHTDVVRLLCAHAGK